MRRIVHVVFTTHWDREWVQSFEQYRYRLIRLFDKLLDILEAEKTLVFVFDGQTIVLEDYLQIRPENRPRIEKLAFAGRLVFGPWYVLSDLFLEGDEAIVRNLLTGFALASRYGGAMMEGYVPDSFGVIATLPSILNGFGIRCVNMGRGSKAHRRRRDTALFRWTAKDGSSLLAMDIGYGNALEFTYPDIWQDIARFTPNPTSIARAAEHFLQQAASAFPTESIYASAGVDHMEMRAGMGGLLELLNATRDEAFISSTPARFFCEVEAEIAAHGIELESVSGMMRGDLQSPMNLQGVLSTDIPLKQGNRACELTLTCLLEPLAVVGRLLTGYDHSPVLRHAWRLLLAVQPHDSICACSDDKTMIDVHARLKSARELCAIATERMMHDILPCGVAQAETLPALAIFNGLPGRGVDAFDVPVRLPLGLPEDAYDIINDLGARVGTLHVIGRRQKDLETVCATDIDLMRLACKAPRADRPHDALFSLCRAEGAMDFGACAGLVSLGLAKKCRPQAGQRIATASCIDNGLVSVAIAGDGRVTFTDKASGRVWQNLAWFEDEADVGNTYDFLALAGDAPRLSWKEAKASTRLVRHDSDVFALELTLVWDLPAHVVNCPAEALPTGAPATSTGARSGRMITHLFTTVFTIRDGLPRVDVRTVIENRSVGHRLRLGLAFERRAPLYAGAHFSIQEYDWADATDRFPTRPFTGFIGCDDGLALLCKGLYEFEARRRNDGGDVLVTCCRSTDRLGPAAGCDYEDLEHSKALCRHEIDYAFAVASSPVAALRMAQAFVSPLLAHGYIPGDQGPLSLELVSVANPAVVVSALKRAEAGNGVIVRFWNAHATGERTVLRWALPHAGVKRVELSEAPSGKLPPRDLGNGTCEIELGPCEIVTLLFHDFPPCVSSAYAFEDAE